MEKVELSIGSYTYFVSCDRIKLFPTSYFAVALRDTWLKDSRMFLRIEDRNIDLFEHIVDYLRFGCVPRGRNGDCLIDREMLQDLRLEADYFCLYEMMEEIDGLQNGDTPHHNSLRSSIQFCADVRSRTRTNLGIDVINTYDYFDDKMKNDSNETDEQTVKLCAALTKANTSDSPFAISSEVDLQLSINTEDLIKINKNSSILPIIMSEVFISLQNVLQNDITADMLQFSQLHVITEGDDRWWRIDETNDKLLLIVSNGHKGGKMVVRSTHSKLSMMFVTDAINHNSKVQCIMIRNDSFCVIDEVTKNKLVILEINVLKNVPNLCAHLKCNNEYLSPSIMYKINCENEVMELISSILTKRKYFGIILEKDYIAEGLTPNNLVGFDAILYKHLKHLNIPISILYVLNVQPSEGAHRNSQHKFHIRLLNDQFDTRLAEHKAIDDIDFIRPQWDTCGHSVFASSYKTRTIQAVMILGSK